MDPLPAFAAVMTLALGVGANTAIFSVLHAVMLKPLPYPEPDQLVQLWSVDLDSSSNPVMAHRDKQLASTRQLDLWGELNRSFRSIAYYRPWLMNFSRPGDPERIPTALVSPGFLATLGVPAARGSLFTRADAAAGRDRVAILSDRLWRRRFGANPNALGKEATIDGDPYTVVGILPPDFRLVAASVGEEPDLYVPI
jgi:putative ABC transport system permease protein